MILPVFMTPLYLMFTYDNRIILNTSAANANKKNEEFAVGRLQVIKDLRLSSRGGINVAGVKPRAVRLRDIF